MASKYQKGLCQFPASAKADDEEGGEEEDEGTSTDKKSWEKGAQGEDAMEIIGSVFPPLGAGAKPLSALNRELVPEYFEQPAELFDEFGFRLPETEDSDGRTDPTAERPPVEISSHRMRWLAMVQQCVHAQVEDTLTWGQFNVEAMRDTVKFARMVREEGMPHSLRPFLWPRLSGASGKRMKCPLKYAMIVQKSARESAPAVDVQIEKDLLRTLPTHFSFSRLHSPGISSLRRILRALAFLFPELGYCQGMGMVAASLLLVCCEENTFWMMSALIEDILPSSYYSTSLLGVRADERVLCHLVKVHMPELAELLETHSADITMISVNWLITLLASAFPHRLVFRIWDNFFAFGFSTIFRIILAMLKSGESNLFDNSSAHCRSSDLFAAITRIPASIGRIKDLLEMAQSFEYSVTDHLIDELRKKYQRILMTESGLIGGGAGGEENLPKQRVIKRNFHRSKSIVRRIFDKKESRKDAEPKAEDENDPRTKNIRQTELVLDLRNAILQICAHFAECNEERHRSRTLNIQADYSVGFDGNKERDQFFRARREGRRRARALIDFERKDEDDLGFRINDLIEIVQEKDEHCWVGELDGRRGWFPAKFVQVLDERGKDYCCRGDEAICSRIVDLVRGPLSFAFRQILFHGFRSSHQSAGLRHSSSSAGHPWHFIESLSRAIVPSSSSDNRQRSANSKASLCHTFRLDRDGRVIGPEELLHLAIRQIHRSHSSSNAPADAKLRSLVAFGLNEQCLHLWFDMFCHFGGQDQLHRHHFRSFSFIRSPISLQICCELKLLSQFGFNLDIDSELISAEELARRAAGMMVRSAEEEETEEMNGREEKNGRDWRNGRGEGGGGQRKMREGARDMLIKHHLFSWDL